MKHIRKLWYSDTIYTYNFKIMIDVGMSSFDAHLLELRRIKLHCLFKRPFSQFFMHIFINVVVYRHFLLLRRVVVCITLPTLLLLLFLIVLVIFLVFAFQTNTILTTRHSLVKAQTIFLSAMGFLAGTKDEILHSWFMPINLLEVMHILAVFLF